VIEPQGHGSEVVPVRLVRDRAGAAAGSPAKWARSRSRAHFFGPPRPLRFPLGESRPSAGLVGYLGSSASVVACGRHGKPRRRRYVRQQLDQIGGGFASGLFWTPRPLRFPLGWTFERLAVGGYCFLEGFLAAQQAAPRALERIGCGCGFAGGLVFSDSVDRQESCDRAADCYRC
jgi:hypothetical protein